jgi:hypothetical protein
MGTLLGKCNPTKVESGRNRNSEKTNSEEIKKKKRKEKPRSNDFTAKSYQTSKRNQYQYFLNSCKSSGGSIS